jgi:hypothetical protein
MISATVSWNPTDPVKGRPTLLGVDATAPRAVDVIAGDVSISKLAATHVVMFRGKA